MSPQTALDADALLAEEVASYYADPLGFVLFAFPWGTGQLAGREIDDWQRQYLIDLGEAVAERGFNGVDAVRPILEATASGHGVGKSALVAWIILWIMSTRPFAKGIVTANTQSQLKTKTWAELGKWWKLSATRNWFAYSAGRGSMALHHKNYPETWRCDAQTCREENSESFAGLHAANSTPFYIFDEASAVPDKIWEVAEGGTTDGEPQWHVFGNPTRNVGRFRECFRRFRHRWRTRRVDSRDVAITNKAKIQEWIDDHGEDSDFVKIRVRGVFPAQSSRQFISEAHVEAAFGRHLRLEAYSFAPVVLGVDPAWTGEDEFVIVKRQGLYSAILGVYERNDDDIHMANVIARFEAEEKAAAVFVDAGFGTGIVSAGSAMGRSWRLVWFSGASPDRGCVNMRAYIWKQTRDWLKAGGAIPPDDVLRQDLTGVETVPQIDGKTQLMSKEDMRKMGLPSPNRGDALALTFAAPITMESPVAGPTRVVHDFDPYDAGAE